MSRPHLRDPKLEQFWRTTLTKWTRSGLNIRDFCRRHRLQESAFYFWRREIAARGATKRRRFGTTLRGTERQRVATRDRPAHHIAFHRAAPELVRVARYSRFAN
jgi:hypothetical protein